MSDSANSQSKKSSLFESLINTGFGLILSVIFTQIICWFYNIPLTMENNLIITFWLTIISIIRGYIIRRLFNRPYKSI